MYADKIVINVIAQSTSLVAENGGVGNEVLK